MKRMYHYRGQSMVDYVLLLGVISAALIAMQVYMKRGIQAAVKVSCDQLGPQEVTINSRKQASTVSTTNATKSGSLRTQVFSGGTQEKTTSITDTTSGSSVSISTQD